MDEPKSDIIQKGHECRNISISINYLTGTSINIHYINNQKRVHPESEEHHGVTELFTHFTTRCRSCNIRNCMILIATCLNNYFLAHQHFLCSSRQSLHDLTQTTTDVIFEIWKRNFAHRRQSQTPSIVNKLWLIHNIFSACTISCFPLKVTFDAGREAGRVWEGSSLAVHVQQQRLASPRRTAQSSGKLTNTPTAATPHEPDEN